MPNLQEKRESELHRSDGKIITSLRWADGKKNYEPEHETRLLKRNRTTRGSDQKLNFTFKENNEAVLPREDVETKLSQPFTVGGVHQGKRQLVLPCSLTELTTEQINDQALIMLKFLCSANSQLHFATLLSSIV